MCFYLTFMEYVSFWLEFETAIIFQLIESQPSKSLNRKRRIPYFRLIASRQHLTPILQGLAHWCHIWSISWERGHPGWNCLQPGSIGTHFVSHWYHIWPISWALGSLGWDCFQPGEHWGAIWCHIGVVFDLLPDLLVPPVGLISTGGCWEPRNSSYNQLFQVM